MRPRAPNVDFVAARGPLGALRGKGTFRSPPGPGLGLRIVNISSEVLVHSFGSLDSSRTRRGGVPRPGPAYLTSPGSSSAAWRSRPRPRDRCRQARRGMGSGEGLYGPGVVRKHVRRTFGCGLAGAGGTSARPLTSTSSPPGDPLARTGGRGPAARLRAPAWCAAGRECASATGSGVRPRSA